MLELEGALKSLKGDVELLVVRFLGGDFLEHETWSDEDFYKLVFDVSGAPFQNLIRDATDQWKPGETKGEVCDEGVLFWKKHVRENADDKDDENKTCATTWMETCLFFRVFHREVEAFFVGPDCLVLSAVVLEDPMHLFRVEHEREVADKDSHFNETIDEVEEDVVVVNGGDHLVELSRDEKWDEFKEEDTDAEGDDQ